MARDIRERVAGSLIFIGSAQLAIIIMVAESLYPGYSISGNYISDLGVGSTALIFNLSMIVLGILAIIAAFLLRRSSFGIFITILLAGIGSAGVGVFPETAGHIHGYMALLTFFFGAIASYFVLAREKNATAVAWAVMGSIALVALGLYFTGNFMGLGKGGMERMIAYPDLFWLMGFGGLLSSNFVKKDSSIAM